MYIILYVADIMDSCTLMLVLNMCQYAHHRRHCKEYLVSMINKAGIDPGEFMDLNEISALLRRDEKQVPNKQSNEANQAYIYISPETQRGDDNETSLKSTMCIRDGL